MKLYPRYLAGGCKHRVKYSCFLEMYAFFAAESSMQNKDLEIWFRLTCVAISDNSIAPESRASSLEHVWSKVCVCLEREVGEGTAGLAI